MDELEALIDVLDGLRAAVLKKLAGLSEVDARRSTVPSTSSAPSTNRPCGLLARSSSPPSSVEIRRARRWIVWPSGTAGSHASILRYGSGGSTLVRS